MIFTSKLAKALRNTATISYTKRISEGFDMSRRKLGEVPFRMSNLTDPHIKKLILDAANKTKVPASKILAELGDKIKSIEECKKYSPILYDTLSKDAVSQVTFSLIEHADVDPRTHIKFDVPTFMELVKMVELEHSQFFPLRAPGEVNYIFHITPVLVPSRAKELQKFNDVPTACATVDGEFVFNTQFMQKLLDWAVVENLKPKGKKYASNGGPIPDGYAYIEFLIMHELLHYSYGDFTHMKKLSQYNQMTHNWASDLRSNYMLVKNGYEQLPIGLFSDHINYDRQQSYAKMIELVDKELKKLPEPLKQDIEEIIVELDDHPSPSPPSPSSPPPSSPTGVSIGDLVKNNKGEFGQVTKIYENGDIDIKPVKVTMKKKGA